MKFNFKRIKPYIKYFVLFLSFLFFTLIVQEVNLDEVWNYGFSHNIYKGEVPYKDFNMVITPLFPFIMSLPFHIFGSSMLVFHIEQAIILTIIFYLLEKMLGDKSYLLLLLLIFPLPITFPSYNIFLLLLFLIILVLEKNKANDYLIGFVLACVVLTKQTVGIMMILPSLYYLKEPKKIFKRFIGAVVPGIIFLLYLFFTESIKQFFDLCLFGLIDFTDNGSGISVLVILSILLVFCSFYLIRKDKNNINNYYYLAFSSLAVPLFDYYHVQIVLIAFLCVLFLQKEVTIYLKPKLLFTGVFIFLSVIMIYERNLFDARYPNDIKHFEYRYVNNDFIKRDNDVDELLKKYDDEKIIYLVSEAYYLKIVEDLDIDYFDLINVGNWGYDGSSKLISKIKENKQALFLLNEDDIDTKNSQIDQNVLKFIMNNGKIVDSCGTYNLYKLK